MKVKFYATLRRVVGSKEVEFNLGENPTVSDLIAAMTERFPGLRHELLDEHGQLYRHVHIFVNSRDASFLDGGMDATLNEDDAIGVFPAVGGG